MEGILLVPPERGTIIGRALWKPRYVVVGSGQREQQTNLTFSQIITTSRIQAASRSSNVRGQPRGPPEAVYLSIYKSKDDLEPIQQHAVNSITDCQIQKVAHRKQGPVLPTLILNISPDPATDKLRKRRSSRTAGLTTTKETHPTSLWFRPGDEQYTLQDWAKFIQPMIQPGMPDRSPLSPISPTFPSFTNPFAPRREGSDLSQRPSSGNGNHWGGLHQKFSNHTHSSRERPITFSDSHSLRSKTSDISSHASSMAPHQMMHQNYTTAQYAHRGHPGDLPSPATTLGEYQGEFIEGWTSAQGRSSTLSSPIRERGSLSSQATPLSETMQSPAMSSSPPMQLGPRETILDRAFQLRCIPGSEVETPGEEKLTSLARFDALMREADEKRRMREAEEAKLKAQDEGLKSAWDLDDDDDDDSDEEEEEDDDSDDDYGRSVEDRYGVPPPAQRALDYITGRHQSPRPQLRSRAQTGATPGHTPLNYNAETLQALNSGPSLLRPQTSYGRNRPDMAQRAYSQPQLAGMRPAPHHAALDIPSRSVSGKAYDDGSLTATASPLHRSATEKRASNSSTNRLSFNELAKRLSSTSSLLLVQTNNSASSRGSSDTIGELQPGLRGPLSPRGATSPSQLSEKDGETRCGWRGSVGVFGVEGGFL